MRPRRAVISAAALAGVLGLTRWSTGQWGSANAIEMDEDVRYGAAEAGGEELLLDVYHPSPGGPLRPAVIVLHGGGFVSGSRADFSVVEPARRLAEVGYVAFSIDYRLLHERDMRNAWPAPLDDAQR